MFWMLLPAAVHANALFKALLEASGLLATCHYMVMLYLLIVINCYGITNIFTKINFQMNIRPFYKILYYEHLEPYGIQQDLVSNPTE